MNEKNKIDESKALIDRLSDKHILSVDEYKFLLDSYCKDVADYARQRAVQAQGAIYGKNIFIRGLIEISNYCKNDCLYCGIRKSNDSCQRYRLTAEQIMQCCDIGYELGFRSFVLQGGEDGRLTDEFICDIVRKIKSAHSDCAVTLSIGEKPYTSYKAYFDAGADRYLLRHETADSSHYALLHTSTQSFDERMRCLMDLRDIGYQVGCGFMVGSPYQSNEFIAKDLKFIEQFKPDMCGIGPFIPHSRTPFADFKQGSAEITCYLLSLIRLIYPNVLLPSTTALASITPNGREMGIMCGANVIMPNLSPPSERKKYELYNNKLCFDDEAAENIRLLNEKINKIGYKIVTSRGDIIREE